MPILSAYLIPHPPIILPEVGHGDEQRISTTSAACYAAADAIVALQPEVIVLCSPHSVLYEDYFHISPDSSAKGDLHRFHAPDVRVNATYDVDYVNALCELCEQRGIAAGTLGERDASLDHGTIIPLHFINQRYTAYKLVRIGLSGMSVAEHYRMGMAIADVADATNKRTVFIASGDLSHRLAQDGPYGFNPHGPRFDAAITNALSNGDVAALMDVDATMAENAGECGYRSIIMLCGAMHKHKVKAKVLSYEGPFGVGYAVASVVPDGTAEYDALSAYNDRQRQRIQTIRDAEDAYVKLARNAVEHYVNNQVPLPLPDNLPPDMTARQAGTFVSLKQHGNLRGCIGTFAPTTRHVADEIIQNAASACSDDPRFEPVRADELDSIVYSVDILSSPEPTTERELDPKQYGVIVSSGRKRGLLLPDLEGVDTVQDQLDIAKRKAGIRPNETVTLERFTVERHK